MNLFTEFQRTNSNTVKPSIARTPKKIARNYTNPRLLSVVITSLSEFISADLQSNTHQVV